MSKTGIPRVRPTCSTRTIAVACALAAMLVSVSNVMAVGPWRASAANTSGWSFMTPDERVEHQRRLRGSDTYGECAAYQAQHHASMAERAARAGVVLEPKAESGCERLRVRRRGD